MLMPRNEHLTYEQLLAAHSHVYPRRLDYALVKGLDRGFALGAPGACCCLSRGEDSEERARDQESRRDYERHDRCRSAEQHARRPDEHSAPAPCRSENKPADDDVYKRDVLSGYDQYRGGHYCAGNAESRPATG